MIRHKIIFSIPLLSILIFSSFVMSQKVDTNDPYVIKRKIRGAEILATKAVDTAYVDIAVEVYKHMTSRTDPIDVPAIHEKSEFKIILIGDGDRFSELPHYEGQGRMIDRAGGLGGQIGEFYIGVRSGSPHVLVHELGHGIYHSGIQFDETGGETDLEKWHNERTQAKYQMDFEDAVKKHGEGLVHEVLLAPENTFSAKLAAAWKNAQVEKLWRGTYAGSEPNEYWAEGVAMWFRAYSDVEGDSREYLRKKDAKLYELCRSIFPDTDWKPEDAVVAAKANVPFDDSLVQDQEEDGTADLEAEADEILEEFDSNNDGKIQLSEVPDDIREEVQQADTNDDGVITRDEIVRFLEEMRDEEERDSHGEGDSDKAMDREEERDGAEDEVDAMFNQIDSNADGKIQRSEVPVENHNHFDKADTNQDGVVTREELRNAMGSESRGSEIPGTMTKTYYAIGNPDAKTVVINTQGGPMPTLLTDEFAEVFSGIDLENAYVINVHQAHTLHPDKIDNEIISFEKAKAIDSESTQILAEVVDEFVRKKKRVYVVGISFGAWMVQDLLATQGAIADGYLIQVGRVDMPEEIWKSFSAGGGGYFENGVTPIVESPEEIDDLSELTSVEFVDLNLPKIAAGLGHKRYTKLLNNVDLHKVIYMYGTKDEPVGRLSEAEVAFLKKQKATVLEFNCGHGGLEMDTKANEILNEFIASTTNSSDHQDESTIDDSALSTALEELHGEARMILALLDGNSDGKLQASELEGDAKMMLQGMDSNQDGVITAKELAQISEEPLDDVNTKLSAIDTHQTANRIVPLPNEIHEGLNRHFRKYTNLLAPNGKPIHFLAMDGWNDDRIARTRKVMEHFLRDAPNKKWGDKTALANAMADNHATMVLLNHSRDMDRVMPDLDGLNLQLQDLRANEAPYEGEADYMKHETRDAAYEEVFHLIHGSGLIFVLREYDREIRTLAKSATKSGLWNYDEPNMPGNHFEYIICVFDNYFDLWKTAPTKMEGRRIPRQRPGESFNGEYQANDRASTFKADPKGFAMIEKFNSDFITYTAELPAGFEGLFSIARDSGERYAEKSKHLKNVSLRGENAASITGNAHDNRLAGNSGDNVLKGNGGDDSLFGGLGIDTAVYRGKRSEYTINRIGDLIEVHDTMVNRDGFDVLSGIEILKFADATAGD